MKKGGRKTMSRKGKIICIEGGDSSGKEIQSRKLRKTLVKRGLQVRFLDFPKYNGFFGKLVGQYLRGDFGDVFDVPAKISALPYALDRLLDKDKIEKWLKNGDIIVCNRYVPSNIAFMSAKLPRGKREELIKWIEELEYKKLGLPKENLTIFLHVPARVGQKLTYKKDEKVYMKGKGRGDIHERHLQYLEDAVRQYLWLSANRRHWARIDCMADKNNLRPIEEIHKEIVGILQDRKIIPAA